MSGERESEGTLSKNYILQVLQKEHARSIVNDRYGDGFSVTLGEGDSEAAVEVFPQTRIVRLLSGYSGIELFDVGGVTRRSGRLRFESDYGSEKVAGEVAPDGTFHYIRVPGRDDSGRFEEAPVEASDETPRVTLRGRLGAEPHFRTTTRRGELVASFPLGTHPDSETTEWHPIMAFGERAKRLQEHPLAKGQLVEVVGYVHERVGRTRSGDTKITKQIYATAIRTTLPNPPQGS